MFRNSPNIVAAPVLAVVLALLAVEASHAGEVADSFPSAPPSIRSLRAHEQAEQLFQRGNHERAFSIYRNELAPIGDKYAQYMVGYMLLTGSGVTEDRVAAEAWYQLAAERGTPEFVIVRDQLLSSMTAEQIAVSRQIFIELRRELGDVALMMEAIRKDLVALESRTGSRIASDSSAVTVIDVRRPKRSASGEDYFRQIEKRLEARLKFIGAKVGIEDLNRDVTNLDVSALEARVQEYLKTAD